MTDQEKVRNLMAQCQYAVIAVTLEDGNPWAVPLKMQKCGKDFVEWDSRIDTLHSQSINRNPRVMVLIFSTSKGNQAGVYMQAAVTDIIEKGQYARYRAVIERIWLNDESYKKRQVSL